MSKITRVGVDSGPSACPEDCQGLQMDDCSGVRCPLPVKMIGYVPVSARMNLIGTGILNWPRKERVSDRYGLVAVWPRGDELGKPLPMDIHPLDGVRGQLIAKVLEAKESTHIGDLFREIYPEMPEVGEEIVLGEGIVFYEAHEDGRIFIGLMPEDGRTNDWLDPKKLYRAHAQYVELYFKKSE